MNKVCIFVINFVSCFQCRDIEYPDLSFVAFVPRVLSILRVTCLCILHFTSLLDAFVSRALCNVPFAFSILKKSLFLLPPLVYFFSRLIRYLSQLILTEILIQGSLSESCGPEGKGRREV